MSDSAEYEGVERREGGRNKILRAVVMGAKFQWLVMLILMFFMALGFGFKTPKKSFSDLDAKIETNWRLDSVQLVELRKVDQEFAKDARYLRELVEVMVIVQCRQNLKLAQDSRLPCRRLFREWGIE